MKAWPLVLAGLGLLCVAGFLWFGEGARGDISGPGQQARGRGDGGTSPVAKAHGAQRVAVDAAAASIAEEAEKAVARTEPADVEVLVVRGGERIADCRVQLWPGDGGASGPRQATTGADGSCAFFDVPLGRARVVVPRSTGERALELRAGGTHRLVVELPAGRDLVVRVVDPAGAPVEDAAVWLSTAGRSALGFDVGATDARGELRVVAVAGARHVFAHHPAWGPSARVAVDAADEGVTLALAAQGGALECWVRDVRGAPIADAEVLVGGDQNGLVRSSQGELEWLPGGRVARGDSMGRADFQGLPAGPLFVQARAPGFVGAGRTAAVVAGEVGTFELVLADAGEVWGVVRDARGPVEGALVWATVPGPEWAAPGVVRTAADGSYRLGGLPFGEVDIAATLANHGNGAARVTVAGRTRCDLALRAGARIAGQLVDEAGAPLAGWRVSVAPPFDPTAWWATTQTDAGGRFALGDFEDAAFVVEVREPSPADHQAALVVDGLHGAGAGAQDLVLVVPEANRAQSFVQGVVLDTVGAPLAGAEVWLSAQGRGPAPVATDASGAFELGPVRAGAWEVTADLAGHAPGAAVRLELGVAERHVGVTLQLERAARLVVELAASGAAELDAGIFVDVRDAAGQTVDQLYMDGPKARSSPLAPGTYAVFVLVDEAVVAQGTVELPAGDEVTWRPTW